MQVFGGHGFIKEWGVEQYVRDARINLIYEGTNTIQSLDLIGRKVLQDGGQKLGKFGKLVQDFIKANADKPEMKERSEEHTSELQSLMRISYAVCCLKKKKKT